MKNVIMIGAMASLLAACSSNKVAVMDSPPPHSGVDKEVYEYKSKLANQQVKKMPEWYTKIPEDEERFMQLVLLYHQTYSCLMILQSYLQREHSLTVSTVNYVLKQSRLCQRLAQTQTVQS